MARLSRILACFLLVLGAAVAAGCGNKQDVRTQGETEGVYVDVDELRYQIQLSRILNPADVEDQAYLRGVPEGVEPTAEEVWFAIFLRVQNETEQTHRPADHFEIIDTTEKTYRPVVLDRRANAFAYAADPLPPGTVMPRPDSPAFNGPVRGQLVLFKVDVESLYNRPLEFEISSTRGGGTGLISIDV